MVAHSVYYCKLIYCAQWKESFAIYITLTGDKLSSHPRPVCGCITSKFSIKWNHPPPWCHYTNWVSPVQAKSSCHASLSLSGIGNQTDVITSTRVN